jgi:selenocysteine lyase/cysteine desulfurase
MSAKLIVAERLSSITGSHARAARTLLGWSSTRTLTSPRRYDVGERSNFVLLPMAIEALRQILAWGVENIAASLRGVTDHIEDEAEKLGIEAVPAPMRVGHMIGLGLGPEAPEDLATRLAEENVFVSVRGRNLRVSPHLYNTDRDIERLLDSLARHVRTSAD